MTMTEQKRQEIIEAFLTGYCFPILTKKGRASSGGSADPNQGFNAAAFPEAGIDKYHAWWIYTVKQIWRLKTWIAFRESAEPLAEVCADVINYMLILVSMLAHDGYIDVTERPRIEGGENGKA